MENLPASAQTSGERRHAVPWSARPNPYPCAVCSQTFPVFRLLLAHSQSHVEVANYQCDRCSKIFQHYNRLVSHMVFHERMDKEQAGSHENGTVTSSPDLQEEQAKLGESLIIRFGDTKLHECHVCGKAFSHVGSFNQHMFSHAPSSLFSCAICHQSFATKPDLETHVGSKHEKSRRTMASILGMDCPKSKDARPMVRIQLRVRNPELPLDGSYSSCACNVCGRKFHSGRDRSKHLAVSSRCRTTKGKATRAVKVSHNCSSHHQKFHDSPSLQAVTQTNGQKDTKEVQPASKEPKGFANSSYKCSLCPKDFSSYRRLCAHKKSVHGKRKAKLPRRMSDSTGDVSKSYACLYCSLRFDSANKKKEHLTSSKHCQVIVKRFLERGFLTTHSRDDRTPRPESNPSVCEFCSRHCKDKVGHILASKCNEELEDAVTRYRQKTSSVISLVNSQPDQSVGQSKHVSTEMPDKAKGETTVKTGVEGKVEDNWICLLCGNTVSEVSPHYRTHLKETLLQLSAPTSAATEVTTHELCPWCSKAFQSRHYLRQHLKRHTAQDIVVTKNLMSEKTRCDHCRKKFSCMVALRSHERQVRERTKQKEANLADDTAVASPTAQVPTTKKLGKKMNADDNNSLNSKKPCPMCQTPVERGFKTTQHLKTHMKTCRVILTERIRNSKR